MIGVRKTLRATVPYLIDQGDGGSIILISSTGGLQGFSNFAHYVAAKHGVTGLARTASNELGAHNIRCNSIHPTSVLTDMIDHEAMYKLFRPDLEHPTHEDFREACQSGMNALPTPWLEPVDISNAVVWLASDAARYVTGIALPIDAGALSKVSGRAVHPAAWSTRASATSARRRRHSLCRTCSTCPSTVRVDSTSFSAISRLLSPDATRSATSRSRRTTTRSGRRRPRALWAAGVPNT